MRFDRFRSACSDYLTRTSAACIRLHWCVRCAGKAKLELKDLKAAARRKGGRLLSTHYVNVHTLVWWSCAKGTSGRRAQGGSEEDRVEKELGAGSARLMP